MADKSLLQQIPHNAPSLFITNSLGLNGPLGENQPMEEEGQTVQIQTVNLPF